ncbi:MAG: DNA mismatch repair endonuclease MutL [Clostridia bacterium]|nr:DNA mismatch repair endonuclease MutL [Clostridia bacterium]
MPRINKLDPSIYNLISAGEVVENPASVIKELVENSIDAGASEVDISIIEGGIKEIKVKDNGSGMDKENIYLSYLPHATSKLQKATDLDNISTLGFRGEALASIAAVSHLRIASADNENGLGYQVEVSSGKIDEEGEIGMSQGTIITVSNLFYNTPVRLKFLKSAKQEESLVKYRVSQLIFANPDVKFTFEVDGEVVFQTSGGLEDAIYAIYGNDVANGLLPFEYKDGDYKVFGYTSNVDLVRHNKNSQTIIVNGRSIENQNIQIAVQQAYGERLMKRTFPIYVLNIIMPFDKVDVNVHPTKSDVRFQDNHKIFSIVYHAIQSAFVYEQTKLNIAENFDKSKENYEQQSMLDFENRTFVQNKNEQMFTNSKPSNFDPNLYSKNGSNINQNSAVNHSSNLQDLQNMVNLYTSKISESSKDSNNLESQIKYSQNMADKNNSNLDNVKSIFDEVEEKYIDTYQVVGQLFETFLIVQQGPYAYLIDTHACHEKFLYENWIDRINKRDIVSQPLMLPYVLDCTSTQYEIMKQIKSNLEELGFEIDDFGDLTFKISAVPVDISQMNLAAFFENVLQDKSITQNLKASDLLISKLAQWACKAAVKAGDRLTDAQVKELFRQMKQGLPMQCPHGRPCIFTFTRTDLDKKFKRIE